MFDPNQIGIPNGNIFGFPNSYEDAKIIIIPVPWDVTTSYTAGTAQGPQAILNASPQLDFYHRHQAQLWETGVYMLPISKEWQQINEQLRPQAKKIIDALENGLVISDDESLKTIQQHINEQTEALRKWVYREAAKIVAHQKIPIVLGGEHSSPLGLIDLLAHSYPEIGILQIDAHADLREAYEGFKHSHASIMYNALFNLNISSLVSVGIRDVCQAELDIVTTMQEQIHVFFDWEIKEEVYYKRTKTWDRLCNEIIAPLPEKVYLSFDIDGLDPKLCPHTGTPVPGGLTFYEAMYLIEKVVASGREIIGADLCEVAPAPSPNNNEWDANVGARVLFELCCWMS